MRRVIENRFVVSVAAAAALWAAAWCLKPFPEDNPVLELVRGHRPGVYAAIRWTYAALWFTTPLIAASTLLSLAYVFTSRRRPVPLGRLPLYRDPAGREALEVVLGEVHHVKKPGPSARPRWLSVPERGLYTGILVVGAIGTGKTSGCMHPFALQVLSYRNGDPERRIGGLVLEVKGDFCRHVRRMLESCGRAGDYVELGLDSGYRYNPLHNDLEAYALAYGIASLLNNLYGRGREPFWQQAYTNLVKFIILLHKVLYGYVTLFDVYECAINPDLLEERIGEGRRMFAVPHSVFVKMDHWVAHGAALRKLGFRVDRQRGRLRAPGTDAVSEYLSRSRIPCETEPSGDAAAGSDPDRLGAFEAVCRWFHNDWRRIEPKLRTSIVEGIAVFLSLFDDNPAVKRVFCPPKECYDPEKNADGRYGIPLPPFSDLIEKGTVCALNFPVSANPGLARAVGTLLKLDFERAVLNRIPKMEAAPEAYHRQVLFLCDEYHAFATVGENDPSGDEKFFSLSRQARCIPIVATQSLSSFRSALPGESWRTLLQTFRTKIFLALSDDFSARVASDLCGREEQLKEHYSISESGAGAGINMMTGRSTARTASVSASRSYSVVRDRVFEPKAFFELRNAQAVVLAYDGFNPLPPCYCYLKPHYLDPNRTYFEQLAEGGLRR